MQKGILPMILATKRILAAVVIFCSFLIPLGASAQGDGNVLINTDPQGSLVTLTGDITMSGVTPVRFDRTLSGKYKIEIVREGYERYRSEAYFSQANESQLDIKLVTKKRTKAFLRSMIIPGWGQKYYGSKTKSTLFALGTVFSAIGYYFVKDDHDSKVDTYNDRLKDFNDATQWSELSGLEARLREAQERANDAEDKLNFIKAAVATVYVVSLLDSFLFFPETTTYTEYKAISAKPDVDQDKIGVKLALKF
jgi:hypothetical protein